MKLTYALIRSLSRASRGRYETASPSQVLTGDLSHHLDGRGLDSARIWVGDFGRWKRAGGRFKTGPSFVAEARFDADASVMESALAAFGAKYPDEWGKWKPRFRKGLEDGSRVLIRYRPVRG